MKSSGAGTGISRLRGRAPAVRASALRGVTLMVAICHGSAARSEELPGASDRLRTDSRAPFVHRIGLYDETGGAIDPTDKNAPPYSPRVTCGKCHEVGTIAHGWHFNAGMGRSTPAAASAESGDQPQGAGRPGEPWIYVDAALGVEIPLSYRGWAGTYRPEQLGLSAWSFVKRFGRHLPGGGAAFPPEVGDPPGLSRWPLAGGLDIDCLLCHSDDVRHDPVERSRQVERENFRWIPTVSAGLAVVRGDVSKLPDDFDLSAGPNPDFPELRAPKLEYDRSRFDADNRVVLGITRRPSPERCYFCHSVREVGAGAPAAWHTDGDVHLRAGMTCTDCHRNGIDHRIVRGYEGEPAGGAATSGASLTCRGCHMGDTSPPEHVSWAVESGPGRLGAPAPRHAGLPAFHLEEMSCTACHSGPAPGMSAKRFQTSLAHALGVPTRERGDTTNPIITGPVLLPDASNRLAPHRLVWPRFWAFVREGEATPLEESRARQLLKKPLAGAQRSPHDAGLLSDEQILAGLKAMKVAAAPGESPAYVALERMYTLTADGSLNRESSAAGRAYAWPIAHDVRPARQALGARGCTECHANDAPLHAGRVVDASLASSPEAPRTTLSDARGADADLARAWNRSMRLRETFKLAAFAGVGMLGWFALARGLSASARWTARR